MNDQILDSKIKAYYKAQRLPSVAVQRIIGARAEGGIAAPRRWSPWLGVAAAAGLAMLLSFHFVKGGDENSPIVYEVAGEMAMRHNSDPPLDVAASTYEEVQDQLENLVFTVTPVVKRQLLSAYEVLGARYCQIQGRQGAHLKLRHRGTGVLCSLYVASLDGPLADLDDTDAQLELEQNKVMMWSDSGRLFALIN